MKTIIICLSVSALFFCVLLLTNKETNTDYYFFIKKRLEKSITSLVQLEDEIRYLGMPESVHRKGLRRKWIDGKEAQRAAFNEFMDEIYYLKYEHYPLDSLEKIEATYFERHFQEVKKRSRVLNLLPHFDSLILKKETLKFEEQQTKPSAYFLTMQGTLVDEREIYASQLVLDAALLNIETNLFFDTLLLKQFLHIPEQAYIVHTMPKSVEISQKDTFYFGVTAPTIFSVLEDTWVTVNGDSLAFNKYTQRFEMEYLIKGNDSLELEAGYINPYRGEKERTSSTAWLHSY